MRATSAILILAACGGGGSDGPDGPPGPDAAPGDPFADRIGTLFVAEQDGLWDGSPGATSAVRVTLEAGNGHPFHHEVGRQGECRHLDWEVGSCPIVCDGVCTSTGCVPWPVPLDAGTITFTGTHAPIEILRDTVSGRYYHAGALPAELFDAGATITAIAAGGPDLDGFALSAPAPDPIAATIDRPLELPHADDIAIEWTAGGGDASVLLTLTSPNAGHGAPYETIIECASADDGLITVPGSYIEALGSISGTPCLVGHECPPSTLSRYRATRIESPAGDIELRVATELVFFVRHDPIN
jgi:hypothetical protein